MGHIDHRELGFFALGECIYAGDVAKGEVIRFKNQQTVVWTKDKKG
jgi:hypothetical protein